MSKFYGGEVRAELIQELRTRADQGADVPQLVEILQHSLELDDRDAILPIILYFCEAFDLTLREALPLREWLGGRDRTEVDSLLIPAMRHSKPRWKIRDALPA
jgi:hypothetical protein